MAGFAHEPVGTRLDPPAAGSSPQDVVRRLTPFPYTARLILFSCPVEIAPVLFNSVEFFVFFAAVYVAYRLLPGVRSQNRMLLLASYVFYGWWDVRFLYLVVLSTGLDFCCGLILGPGRIPGRDRVAVSAALVLAAAVFVVPKWDAIGFAISSDSGAGTWHVPTPAGTLAADLGRLTTPDQLGWTVLAGTFVAVLLANLVYYPLASLSESRRRRVGLFLTVGSNLLFLGFFKYFNFFIDSADALLSAHGTSAEAWHLHIILPAGISFYTFQSLSYTLDVYKGKVEAVRRLEDYALFVMFFPVLLAGPIERAGHMIPKLARPRVLTLDQTTRGLFLILFGLMKKVAIADGLAPAVNSVYNSPWEPSRVNIVNATVLFAFQIYCDFSGYTDIARGVAKVLGIDLLHNFNLPYFSRGPSEFWRRWHITLSSWLGDYLYIPLGGNRRGAGRTYLNLMVTMILGGLWHGAAWNFVLWGYYQGALLCAYRFVTAGRSATGRLGPAPEGGWRKYPLENAAALGLFFALTCYGWLLFRATSLNQVVRFTAALVANLSTESISVKPASPAAELGLCVLIAFEFLEYLSGSPTFYREWPPPVRGAFYALVAFILVMGFPNEPAQFIYFRF